MYYYQRSGLYPTEPLNCDQAAFKSARGQFKKLYYTYLRRLCTGECSSLLDLLDFQHHQSPICHIYWPDVATEHLRFG